MQTGQVTWPLNSRAPLDFDKPRRSTSNCERDDNDFCFEVKRLAGERRRVLREREFHSDKADKVVNGNTNSGFFLILKKSSTNPARPSRSMKSSSCVITTSWKFFCFDRDLMILSREVECDKDIFPENFLAQRSRTQAFSSTRFCAACWRRKKSLLISFFSPMVGNIRAKIGASCWFLFTR